MTILLKQIILFLGASTYLCTITKALYNFLHDISRKVDGVGKSA